MVARKKRGVVAERVEEDETRPEGWWRHLPLRGERGAGDSKEG